MEPPPALHISPPLLNSANPWATTLDDLRALFACPSTGAVTTRTALLAGFAHDPAVHQYSFFDPATNTSGGGAVSTTGGARSGDGASLNNMGYSPVTLDAYLRFIETIATEAGEKGTGTGKGFIVSVTGSPDDVAACYVRVAQLAARIVVPLAVEVNLSCPNIPGAPPPAYEGEALGRYLDALARVAADMGAGGGTRAVPWGVKTPPYTHAGQFGMFISALKSAASTYCPVSFVTATNTLGSCLVLENTTSAGASNTPRLAGTGIGGMAGAPLHPLALGNVATLRRLLDAAPETRHVQIIGVGGVEDAAGYRRMRDVGAAAVGVGTALGRMGVAVFGRIEDGLRDGEEVSW
ncbi:dihydroorotate dehydrogenase [Hypoxylon crocopeplum]|nr:dihydroorotate dehydrogenase [Hypoxylon crocopeplum]